MKLYKFTKLKISGLSTFLLPLLASAQADFNLAGQNFLGIVGYLMSLLASLNPILFFLAFVVFFWGLSKFILNGSGNAAELKKGKSYMMWGILALFILVSFQAIVSMISNELQLGPGVIIPELPHQF